MLTLLAVGFAQLFERYRDGLPSQFDSCDKVLLRLQPGETHPVSIEPVDDWPDTVDVVLSSQPVPQANGSSVLAGRAAHAVLGVLLTCVDMSQRESEDQSANRELSRLREVQSLLAAIIQSTQDAISVVDKDGLGLLINPAYSRLTGYQPEDVIGKPADVDIAEGESMHLRVLRTGQPVKNVPLKVGPHRREVIVNVAPLYVNDTLRGSVGVIHDVSEIKHLTEELERTNRLLRSVQAKYTFEDVVGDSAPMRLAVEQARRAASTPAAILLRGESGTGKELFAHAVHHESQRSQKAFVRVNCAALSDSLLESELFGYEEGAFTGAKRGGRRGVFEEASGGTLFLDEIGELSPTTQAKLLRALQEHEIVRVGGTKPVNVDVRVITATHIHLEQAVAQGRFREDLYYRINVVPIVIPPLRYRREDIPALAEHIVRRHNLVYGRNVQRFSTAAMARMSQSEWPGNVRELENTLGRAMIHMDYRETVLEDRHLPPLGSTVEADFAPLSHSPGRAGRTLQDMVRETERSVIGQVLIETNGNKTEAARRLGISVRSLYYKMDASDVQG